MIHSAGLQHLDDIAGPEGVDYDQGLLREHGWQGALPKACVAPSNEEQLCEIMRLASAEGWKVAPAGNLTKLRLGGIPEAIDLVISSRRLNQVTDYEPADLTITTGAGTSVSSIDAALATHGQMLPLDPPFAADGATIGGVMATSCSGSRRLAYGSVRDMAIGVRFVTADGTLAKSGGKVVKNVAGYDIAKLLIGSWGTLAIMTSATFKVFPLPPETATMVMGFSDLENAMNARDHILNSPLPLQALDLVDASAGKLLREDLLSQSRYTLVAAAAGPTAMLKRIRRELPDVVRLDGVQFVSELTGGPERRLWTAIQEFTPGALGHSPSMMIVKICAVLSQMGHVIARSEKIAAEADLNSAIVARAGTGIAYCYLWPRDGEHNSATERGAKAVETINAVTSESGGWATIESSPPDLSHRISSWSTRDDFAVMQQIKGALDPSGTLNPGRLFGKI